MTSRTKLSAQQIEEALAAVPGWALADDGASIRRILPSAIFRSFAFMTQVPCREKWIIIRVSMLQTASG